MFGFRHGKGAVVLDGKHVADTAQCVHCGTHEEIKPGSGVRRGWCPHCKGFVCGRNYCMAHCTPFEARLDFTDATSEGKAHNDKVARELLNKYPHIRPI